MAEFRLSRGAEADLLSIGEFTLRTWGLRQAARYIDGLEACCRMLSDNPELGRACDNIRPGLRRMEYARHVVFYRQITEGVFISRILHQRMLPEKQNVGDDEAP